jgi:hypothetical protein
VCRERTVALDRAGRRKADALAAGKEIARSRVCLKLYLVGQRRREQSVLQDVAGMGIKKQNSQGVAWLEDADWYALQAPGTALRQRGCAHQARSLLDRWYTAIFWESAGWRRPFSG